MKDDKIVKLDRWSRKRQTAAGSAAHAERRAFAFSAYTYNDEGFGSIENGEVVFLTNQDELTGVRMSAEDAMAAGAALIQAALAEMASRKTGG